MSTDPELLLAIDGAEVWCGDALNPEHVAGIMDGRMADLLCVDAPYSPKTHEGHRGGKVTADRAAGFASGATKESRYAAKVASGAKARADLDYAAWEHSDVEAFVDLWHEHTRGWMVSITDDVLAQHWRSSYEINGRLAFAGLPLVETGSRVRMTGDGPSNWTCWVMVARPRTREFASWGTLQGAYIVPGERAINSKEGSDRITGGKPMRAMIEIVTDYSREGGLVVDSTCGAGTTLLAAMKSGRRCLGIEKDRGRAELTAERVLAESKCTTRAAMRRGQMTIFDLETA